MTVPNIINDYGVNEVLRRRYNIVEAAPAATMSPELSPVLEAAPFTPDLDFLAGVRRCAGFASVAANPAGTSLVYLSNPAGSGILGTVTRVRQVNCNGPVYLNLFSGNIVGALGAASSIAVDTRWRLPVPTTLTSLTLSIDNAAVLPAASRTFDLMWTGQERLRDDPIILSPGYTLICGPSALNLDLWMAFRWTERRAQPAEL